MKKVTRRQIAEVLNGFVADILTGKAKIESMGVRVDTVDIPGRHGVKETRPTGKSYLTMTIQRKPPRTRRITP